MKLHRRKRLGFSESSAASDMAFLLIVYFIVIAGFNVNKGFLVTLPAKDSQRLILREDILRFRLDNAGSLFYGQNAVDLAAAESLIRAGVAQRPNLALILSVAPNTPWQSVVSFVELAQELEVDSFSFTMGSS